MGVVRPMLYRLRLLSRKVTVLRFLILAFILSMGFVTLISYDEQVLAVPEVPEVSYVPAVPKMPAPTRPKEHSVFIPPLAFAEKISMYESVVEERIASGISTFGRNSKTQLTFNDWRTGFWKMKVISF